MKKKSTKKLGILEAYGLPLLIFCLLLEIFRLIYSLFSFINQFLNNG